MSSALEKILFSLKYEKSKDILANVKNILLAKSGLRVAETYFFRRQMVVDIEFIKEFITQELHEINLVIIKSKQDLALYKNITRKFFLTPFEKWFSRESICLSLELDRHIIAYGWLHFNFYDNLESAGTFHLSNNECWIGPAYVDASYRKKGLSYLSVYHRLKFIRDLGIVDVYTSTSSKNIAPIRYLIKTGFQLIGCIRAGSFRDRVIVDFTPEELVRKKIT